MTLHDLDRLRDYLAEAKAAAMRAESIANQHSQRLAKKLFKVCAELETAQAIAADMATRWAATRTSP